jgi:hypothetical protein
MIGPRHRGWLLEGGFEEDLKIWWHAAKLFIYFYINRAYIQYFIYNTSGVLSRDSNSGLPHSKPTRYCLSHAAP